MMEVYTLLAYYMRVYALSQTYTMHCGLALVHYINCTVPWFVNSHLENISLLYYHMHSIPFLDTSPEYSCYTSLGKPDMLQA